MAFFEGGAKDSEQVHIGVINCAPPFTRQRVQVDLNVEIESAHGEKTEVTVDPLSSRGINKFHWEGDFVPIFSDRARPESLQKIREFKIYDATVTKTSLKMASSSLSICSIVMSICLTFES